ncbi:helix-turn-helix domain-containing protein [Sanguibacter sp. HDW7]|uniref:helix-turn-helix domain-containing protein n=1 Tax=Sanguibacter sp. HDW7 TaxID=2714931 RepID=UPI001408D471|nr:helix-turn-helix domain-containing protein [Sanguibacter sp. HDW7]QIK82573.1 helix-turn-helix domain-containing protein [Sanguibacter sp. HDW7]
MTDATARPSFLTVAEVADAMRVSRMTVYRLVHAGEMPAIRVGKSFRVPASALEQYLAQATLDQDRLTS